MSNPLRPKCSICNKTRKTQKVISKTTFSEYTVLICETCDR